MEGQTSGPPYVGIDIGGTKTLAIVANSSGKVLGRALRSTHADADPPALVDGMVAAARQATRDAGLDESAIRGLGVAAAGGIDAERGIVVWAPQMPSFANTPMAAMLRERWDLPVAMGNDANLAALAEQRFGAAKGHANALFITISTGIGGGIVLNGELYTGASGYAGEIGHMSVDAHGPYGPSRTPGAWETMCSGRALARIANERLSTGESSSLAETAAQRAIEAPDVFAAMRSGDALATAIVNDAIEYLGVGLTSVVNILNPGIIVIGGGLSNEWDAYIAPAVERMREISFADMGKDTPVVPPALGVDSGALGAVALVMERDQRRLT